MKKVASWLVESFQETNTKFDEIISIAVSHKNELNESDMSEIDEVLDEARLNGWYPFVSVYYNASPDRLFDDRIEAIVEVAKDPYIWEVLMLEKELPIIKSKFNEDFDEERVRAKLKEFKAKL